MPLVPSINIAMFSVCVFGRERETSGGAFLWDAENIFQAEALLMLTLFLKPFPGAAYSHEPALTPPCSDGAGNGVKRVRERYSEVLWTKQIVSGVDMVHLRNVIFVGVTKTCPSSSSPHNRSKHSRSRVVHINCINTKRFGMYRYSVGVHKLKG